MGYNKFYTNDNVSYLENKIFKDSLTEMKYFTKFIDISEEQLNRISLLSNNYFKFNYSDLMSQNYINILNYLSTPYGKEKLAKTRNENCIKPTFDEFLAFVISSCDPDCKMYRTYISCPKSFSTNEKYNEARRNTGFFSKRILYAEKDYYHKFKKQLLTNVRQENSKYTCLISSFINSFDDISDERYNELNDLSTIWKINCNNDIDALFTTCLYNIIYQSNILKLNTIEEKIAFLICCIDSELKLLDIYEEECKYDNIKERSLAELGFYDKYLIRLEKHYKKRFQNDENSKILVNKKDTK